MIQEANSIDALARSSQPRTNPTLRVCGGGLTADGAYTPNMKSGMLTAGGSNRCRYPWRTRGSSQSTKLLCLHLPMHFAACIRLPCWSSSLFLATAFSPDRTLVASFCLKMPQYGHEAWAPAIPTLLAAALHWYVERKQATSRWPFLILSNLGMLAAIASCIGYGLDTDRTWSKALGLSVLVWMTSFEVSAHFSTTQRR